MTSIDMPREDIDRDEKAKKCQDTINRKREEWINIGITV